MPTASARPRPLPLLALAVTLDGCSMMGGDVPPAPAFVRAFYLTRETVPANRAPTACALGYHMASRFELLDVSALAYDGSRGFTTSDAGSGPPMRGEPRGEPPAAGWIRTGGESRFTPPAGGGGAATNCAAWTTASHDALGTVAWLADGFGPAAWAGSAEPCDAAFRVWCVQDVAVPGTVEAPPPRRRGGVLGG
jgi:hypothetical protein